MERSAKPSISSESRPSLDRRLYISPRQTVGESADAVGLIRSLPGHSQILSLKLQLCGPLRRDQRPETGITINPGGPKGSQPLLKSPD